MRWGQYRCSFCSSSSSRTWPRSCRQASEPPARGFRQVPGSSQVACETGGRGCYGNLVGGRRRPRGALNLLRRVPRRDLWALAALVVLPLAVFAGPAVSGHPVLLGDDVTQNYPLRAFVGSQIRHGHLPLFDPYIWSGTPLLGVWNAGAAYPFTLLFVVLPATAAWASNLVLTWWVAGVGCFAFLRMSRLAAIPSFLGALSFSFAGAMTAQVVHFGLIAGMSWVPSCCSPCCSSPGASQIPPRGRSSRQLLRSRSRLDSSPRRGGTMAILVGEAEGDRGLRRDRGHLRSLARSPPRAQRGPVFHVGSARSGALRTTGRCPVAAGRRTR